MVQLGALCCNQARWAQVAVQALATLWEPAHTDGLFPHPSLRPPQALSLRQFRLAAALVACGASTSTALLETSLLENTKFDPRVARWLLDMGADVTVPAHHSPRTCLGSAGSISAVVTVLGKAG